MSYTKFYPNGWQSGETGGTPITPEALNHIEAGIEQTYSDFAPAVESNSYPGCYYRTVDGVTEWVNPPMTVGVEYRTTERYNGQPVYVTEINAGTMANADSISVMLPSTPAQIISFSGEAINNASDTTYTFPVINIDNSVWAVMRKTGTRSIAIKSFTDMSNYTAYLTVKYIK